MVDNDEIVVFKVFLGKLGMPEILGKIMHRELVARNPSVLET